MLGVILLPMLDLHVVMHGSTIIDAVMSIDVGIDVLAGVMRQGLIDLLVDVAVVALTA